MHACVLKTPAPVAAAPLEWMEVPKPAPGPDEVLIRVRACGVCRTDLHVVEGGLAVRKPNVIPGHQVVGTVEAGPMKAGTRVGVPWLHRTCGVCEYCRGGSENLCDRPDFTGWTVNGGYADYLVAPADFVYAIPDRFDDIAAAPLLCAGIIGFRCLRLADENPPVHLDASMMFAPAGELVPPALKGLKKGGRLILGGIHMSDIPSFGYDLLYQERIMRSVANNTRDDGRDFLKVAAEIPIRTQTETFPLREANQALLKLKTDGIQGAAVLLADPTEP